MTFKYGSSFAGAENLAMCFDAANPDCYPGSGTTATNLGTRLAYSDNDTVVGIIGSSMTIPTSPARFKTNATSATDDIDYKRQSLNLSQEQVGKVFREEVLLLRGGLCILVVALIGINDGEMMAAIIEQVRLKLLTLVSGIIL